MHYFGRFYLDQEKDILINLYQDHDTLYYILRTPNHHSGNLIRNLAKLCSLELNRDDNGLWIIEGIIPCYIDANNERIYIFRLGNTKVANIFPDGRIEMKASIPSISKTLMSQTKDYKLGIEKTIIKTYILEENKFRTDLHTHMNAILSADTLIALGIYHQIRYPLYYIKKLELRLSKAQEAKLIKRRETAEKTVDTTGLFGKYKERRIDDNTWINFADLILNNPENNAYNIPKIRASLTVLKDGQAVFTNLEKVYLYRYVFTKGTPTDQRIPLHPVAAIQDKEIEAALKQMMADHKNPLYQNNTLFQDKLLWIGRTYQRQGICYVEISDTTLVKKGAAFEMLEAVHEILPKVKKETGVTIRFLAAMRRIPLTLVKDRIEEVNYLADNLAVLNAVAEDPYVAGCDFVGEEINSILDLRKAIEEVVRIARRIPSFVIRIHAGENDSLTDNVANSILCVKEALEEGQKMPQMRIGHGLYTANLNSTKGRELIRSIRENNVILEFQITSNVRLNNLNSLSKHPLKKYLSYGLDCVQGSDGAAIYGTSNIDEQLSLEKLLDLKGEDLKKMKAVEERIMKEAMLSLEEKANLLEVRLQRMTLTEYYSKKLEENTKGKEISLLPPNKEYAIDALKGMIAPMPWNKIPIVLAGGSFNSDERVTRLSEDGKRVVDHLLQFCNPARVFFVIGHKLQGYEKYLVQNNIKGFEIFAVVPSLLEKKEVRRIRNSALKVCISPEIVGMGIYKSFNYEIFERRDSYVFLFDGNAAAANLLQEARNGKGKARIFVSQSCAALKNKAGSLMGYVNLFKDEKDVEGKLVFEGMRSTFLG